MPNTPAPRRGDVLAVVSQSGPTVSFFDATTHRLLDVLAVPAEPHELCFDPEQRLLYCTSTYRSGYYHANTGRGQELTVIDVDARRVVEVLDLAPDHGPHGLALDRARGRLYVSVEATTTAPGGVVVIDTASRKVVGRIDTMAPGPHWFVIRPDGRLGYAANKEAPFVSAVDLDSGELVDRVAVPGSEGIAVSPDGATVAVAAPKGYPSVPAPEMTGLRLIDTELGTIVQTVPTEHVVFPVHFTAAGLLLAGELRMAAGDDGPSALGRQRAGRLSAFARGDYRVIGDYRAIGTVEVGQFPLTITSCPDGSRGYVAAVLSSTVTVVDLECLDIIDTIRVARQGEAGAHGLAYLPARW